MRTYYIPFAPKGKGSVRVTKRGFSYMPTKTKKLMNDIEACVKAQDPELNIGPITVGIAFLFPFTKEMETKKKVSGAYGKKPDIDNCAKLVLDALTGVTWKDDATIVGLSLYKIYVHAAKKGGIIVVIHNMEESWGVLNPVIDFAYKEILDRETKNAKL